MGNGISISYLVENQKSRDEHQPLLKTKETMYCQKYENVFQDCMSAIKMSTNKTVSVCVPIEMFKNIVDMRKSIYYAISKLEKNGYKSTLMTMSS